MKRTLKPDQRYQLAEWLRSNWDEATNGNATREDAARLASTTLGFDIVGSHIRYAEQMISRPWPRGKGGTVSSQKETRELRRAIRGLALAVEDLLANKTPRQETADVFRLIRTKEYEEAAS